MDETTTLKEWTLDLYRRHGRLTPEIVREAARPVDSPAHAFVFNVPPDAAAEKYYLEQAHKLIRHVRVEVVGTVEQPVRRVRFYHAVPGDKSAYEYVTRDDLVTYPDKLAAARTEAVRRLRDAETAVADLDGLAVASPPTKRAAARALKQVRQARDTLTATT